MPARKRNEREPTPRQIEYAKQRVENPTKSKADCAIAAGYAETTAKNKTLEKVGTVRNALQKAFKAAGITDKLLSKAMRDGLKATEVKYFADKGRVCDKRKCPDYATRSRYLDIAFKARGDYIEKHEINGGGNVVIYLPDNGRGKKDEAVVSEKEIESAEKHD